MENTNMIVSSYEPRYLDIDQLLNPVKITGQKMVQCHHQHINQNSSKEIHEEPIKIQQVDIQKQSSLMKKDLLIIEQNRQTKKLGRNQLFFNQNYGKQLNYEKESQEKPNIQDTIIARLLYLEINSSSQPTCQSAQNSSNQVVANNDIYKGFLNTAKLIILAYIKKVDSQVYKKNSKIKQLLKCVRKTNRNEIQMLIKDNLLCSYLMKMFQSGFFYNEYKNCRVKIVNHRLFMRKASLLKKSIIRGELMNLS